MLGRLREAEPDTETPFGKKGGHPLLRQPCRSLRRRRRRSPARTLEGRDSPRYQTVEPNPGRKRTPCASSTSVWRGSKGQESLTLTGDVMGTPQYMSPEQAKRRKIPVDHRTDIYSLGATLYELLASRPPFKGKDHQDTLSQIIERDPRPPRQLNPRVPVDLETIVLKCLRKDVGDRYGDGRGTGSRSAAVRSRRCHRGATGARRGISLRKA